ncbi:hypothetical protein RO3G_00818 [Lichtheimia corymbifera JMRC:FSU:9682]|uniref:SigF-like NTF2-like domain-containing protein n=1 Tax=Lichtheimia corymbifera JMRC:FSU:9682 TaxID=1263082 RepID=A0A068S443_9FUNG|nr:hypothetical protein RO3G_00818 [Lichtheimia corymbifera JMRC:FSU:9682]
MPASDLDTDTQIETSSSALIKNIIEDLFSYSTVRWRRILEYYYFEDATLTSPIMSTEGIDNIQYVYTVWQALNRKAPTINNIVFDGRTAVVHITQNLSPSMFPSFIQLQVPAITTLHFRETEADSGLLKIYRQEDSWTLEGLIQSMPLMSFWYNDVLRVVMGKVVTATGDLLDAALRHAHKMSMRGREIQRRSRDLAIENMEKLDEYRANLHENYLEGIRGWHHQYQDHQDDYLLEDDFRPVKESRNGNNDFYD